MRFLRKVFIAVGIILFISIVAAVVFLKTIDVRKYKDLLAQKISKAVDKEVSLGDVSLSLSFSKGMVLTLEDIKVRDQTLNIREPFLIVKKAVLDVNALEFLKAREIVVNSLLIEFPVVSIDRTETAVSLRETPEVRRENRLKAFLRGKDFLTAQVSLASSMTIRDIQVVGGVFLLLDPGLGMITPLEIKDFHASVDRFSLTKPFNFNARLNFLSKEQENIFIKGQASVDAGKGEVTLSQVAFNTDLSTIQIRKSEEIFSSLAAAEITDSVQGKLQGTVEEMVLGEQGLGKFSCRGEIKDGMVLSGLLKTPLEHVRGNFYLTEKNISISDFFGYFSSGQIFAGLSLDDYTGEQKASFQISGEKISLVSLSDLAETPFDFSGNLSFSSEGKARGLTADAIRKTLTAAVSIQIDDGRILNFNALRFILEKISVVPQLAQKLDEKLPQKYKDKMNQPNTLFKQIVLQSVVSGGRIQMNNVAIDAYDFRILADALMDFYQNIRLNSHVVISEELSGDLIKAAEQFAYLENADGAIHIPMQTYQGPIENLRVFPDMEILGKKMIQTGAKQELKKVIFKALDIEDSSSESGEKAEENQEDNKSGAPEAVIINNVLDAIFGK